MKADEILEELGIEHEVVVQDEPTKDCDDAARERGVETSQIVKSLIIDAGGELLHACIPGDRTLSEKKLGQEYRLVDPEKSNELTGFESGAVHPLSTDLKHVVDERLLENERVSFTTGNTQKGVIIKPGKLREAFDNRGIEYETGDFLVTSKEDIEELKSLGLGAEQASFIVENGYRSIFHEAIRDFDEEKVLKSIRKLHRQQIEFGPEEVRKLVREAENETHMQKLAEGFAESGDIESGSSASIDESVEEVIEENPEALEDLADGKDSAINYLMGRVMESTNGRADPETAKEMIRKAVDDEY